MQVMSLNVPIISPDIVRMGAAPGTISYLNGRVKSKAVQCSLATLYA